MKKALYIATSIAHSVLYAISTCTLQNCVGQSLAKVEMFGIIARICSEFELTLECEGRLDFSLTVKPVGARLIARKV